MRKIKSENFDEIFKAFLNEQKPHTQSNYATCLRYWLQFSGMNGQATLDFKRNDKDAQTEKKVIGFKAWMIQEQKKSENYARVAQACVRGFYASHRVPLVFTRKEAKKLGEGNRTTTDYLFTKEDLFKMSEQGNLQEKYVVIVGKSVGLRGGDFLTLTYGSFRGSHIDGEAPISLGEVTTQKEHVKAYPFLDSDAVQVVRNMLERNPDAKNEDRVLQLDEQSLTLTIQRLAERAHLQTGGKRIRFHLLRKYLFDRLTAVASTEQAKQIIGKAISEGAYLSTDQLRGIYEKAMPLILINGNSKNHAAIEELEAKFADMSRRLSDLLMDNEVLKQRDLERSKEINELKEQFDSLTPEERKRRVVALRQKKHKT
jgi:polyhydroxyalkanoate synthesis regulator phasin